MEKLLAVVSIGQKLYGEWFLQRLLPGLLVIGGLIIVTAIMITTLFAVVMYAVYYALILQGVNMSVALVAVGGLALFIAVCLIAAIRQRFNRIRRIPHRLLKEHAAIKILNDFLDGLLHNRTS